MMFDAFGVGTGRGGRHPDRLEKSHHCLVPFLGARRERTSRRREKNGAVGQSCHQTLALEALDGADNGYVSDTERTRDIGGPSLAVLGDEIGNRFDIILGKFLRVGTARVSLDGGGFPGACRHDGDQCGFDTPAGAGLQQIA